jgi:hypothetical protein
MCQHDDRRTDFTRRQILKATAIGAAGLGFGLGFVKKALASPDAWGEVPGGIWPPGFTPAKILEIHLFGGMAPYESFYYRDVVGSRTRGFDTEVQNLNWDAVGCPNPPAGLELHSFSTDSNAKAIHLGPFAKPLWSRPDIRSRMRVLVERHDLLPHEAAIPFTMTGFRLGRPNLSGLGAPIQHRLASLDQEADNGRVLPHSYALLPQNGGLGSLFSLVEAVQGSIGTHPGFAQPLVLKIGEGFGDFVAQLQRLNLGTTGEAVNALIDQYRSQYRDRLRWPSPAEVVRSRAFRDYETASSRLMESASLHTLLSGGPSAISNGPVCARETLPFSLASNPTRTAIEFAAFLLTRPAAEAASSVMVLDSGLVRTLLPYDVHSNDHAGDTGANLWNVLSALTSVIRDPANPTPDDADKIDLDTTLVVVNMEFGRTPFKSSGGAPSAFSMGRDHWPEAYVSAIFGGPIPSVADGTAGRVVGSISDGADPSVEADIAYSSTDLRAALLLAAGVHPFESENFALGSLTASLVGVDHAATMANLRQTILGVA